LKLKLTEISRPFAFAGLEKGATDEKMGNQMKSPNPL
jgi:hypothetical protein